MNPFNRLREGEATELERLLLESGAEDVPSSGARARTLLAMGAAVGAGATVVAPGAVHAAAGTVAATGAGSAKTAGAMTTLMLAKWLGTGAAVGAVTAACLATVTTPGLLGPAASAEAVSAPALPVRAMPRTGARPLAPDALPNPAGHAVAEPASAPPAPGDRAVSPSVALASRSAGPDNVPAGHGTAPGAPGGAGPSASGTSVLAEVASLDRARSALASGDPPTALTRLAEHQKQFPGGALEPEAVVLGVRALVQLGRRAEATAVVNRFLAAHPDSSQGGRLRTLVGAAPR